jgi:hypothetical protein
VLALSAQTWWLIGWVIGAAVVVVAALLLLAIIALARRIVRQAGEITAALEGAREHTAPMFDLTRTNLELDRIARGLAEARKRG